MFLLPTLIDAIADVNTFAPLMADWLTDNRANFPEVDYYIRRLRNPARLTFGIIFDVVAKYGEKRERKMMRKIMKNYLSPFRFRTARRKLLLRTLLVRKVGLEAFTTILAAKVNELTQV